MFQWLRKLAKRDINNNEFEKAHAVTVEFAGSVKAEYDRIKSDEGLSQEADKITNQFYSSEFLTQSCEFIMRNKYSERYKEPYSLLHSISNMFIIMADHAFPQSSLIPRNSQKISFENPGWESFGIWCRSIKPEFKREILLFAYLATMLEQNKSGAGSPIAYDFRIIIVALAASINEDEASADAANKMFNLIENKKSTNR